MPVLGRWVIRTVVSVVTRVSHRGVKGLDEPTLVRVDLPPGVIVMSGDAVSGCVLSEAREDGLGEIAALLRPRW